MVLCTCLFPVCVVWFAFGVFVLCWDLLWCVCVLWCVVLRCVDVGVRAVVVFGECVLCLVFAFKCLLACVVCVCLCCWCCSFGTGLLCCVALLCVVMCVAVLCGVVLCVLLRCFVVWWCVVVWFDMV